MKNRREQLRNLGTPKSDQLRSAPLTMGQARQVQSKSPAAMIPPLRVPDTKLANRLYVDGLPDTTTPDGATYYLPENVTPAYITAAIEHLRDADAKGGRPALYNEFYQMFTDPKHPNFIDFKDWGPRRGPPNSLSGGRIRYFSPARGEEIDASPFEPAGNLLYGFIGRMAGLSPEELTTAAAWTQEGRPWQERAITPDSAEDAPHVDMGIRLAQSALRRRQTALNIRRD